MSIPVFQAIDIELMWRQAEQLFSTMVEERPA